MTTIDPERERRRLTELYRGMSDEELESVADDGKSLSDIARGALTAEIEARHLNITVQPAETGSDELEQRDLVMIRKFGTLPEALVARGRLESAGIESVLYDDNMVRVYVPTFVQGMRLMVDRENVEEAAAILDEPTEESVEAGYEPLRCPECRSLDVTFQRGPQSWICNACRYVWLDEEPEEESEEPEE